MGAVDNAHGGGGGSIGSGLAGAAGLRLQAGRHEGCGDRVGGMRLPAREEVVDSLGLVRLSGGREVTEARDEADNAAAEAGADGEEGEDAGVDGMWFVTEVGAD